MIDRDGIVPLHHQIRLDLENRIHKGVLPLGVPYVLIKRSIPGVAVHCVVSDDVAGAALAVRHLLQIGHRRIGSVFGPTSISIWRQRRLGYEQALREAGLAVAVGPGRT